ncbi:MAG: reverse transcriptase family protein [Gemmataceae bacterium]
MLKLPTPQDLAGKLGVPLRAVHTVLRDADAHYEQLELPQPGGKIRRVVNPRGLLRRLQSVFYESVLLPGLERSPYSHGGVRGRNILTNVKAHLGQTFVFTADLADFYPSIRRERVFRLFERLGLSQEVARLCSRLCTFNHRLEQGLVTSPILADQLMAPVDERIAGSCRRAGLVYTRFVDDLAISGPFDLEPSGIPALVRRIVGEHGFHCNEEKDQFGQVARGATVTQLRLANGHPDVRATYLAEVERQLQDAARLAGGGPFQGPYHTEAQIRGRVAFVCWVNPRRKRRLLSLCRQVNWPRFREEARLHGLERETGVGHTQG